MIIILYVMDSLRSDFLSCYGYKKETSPNIDRLAKDGVLFRNVFSQSTWTRSSGASLLSSLYPSVHGVFTVEDYLSGAIPLLPEYLKRAGFETIAISSLGNISPDFGFGRGFDHFVELYKEKSLFEKRRRLQIGSGINDYEVHFKVDGDSIPIATSEDINLQLFSFLKEVFNKNLFCLVWSMDTHNPYFQRDPAMARFNPPTKEILWSKDIQRMNGPEEVARLKSFYEEMIYYNDYYLGELISTLKKLGLYDDTFLIVTGDHGEGFGEHGLNSHSQPPYDHQIRVPLIMKFPRHEFAGTTLDGIVQHIDIMPTIMEYKAILSTNIVRQGKSLLSALKGEGELNKFAYTEYQINRIFHSYISIRTNEYKLMEARRPQKTCIQWLKGIGRHWPSHRFVYKPVFLFEMQKDPSEKVNVIRKEKEVTKLLHDAINQIMAENDRLSMFFDNMPKIDATVDEEIAKQLNALGYFD